MAADQNGHEEWVGSAYLFLESSMDKVVLSEAYTDPKKKVAIYKALQAALSESGDSPDVLQILKIHCSDPQLIVQLRFCGRLLCGRFLQAYREGALRTALQRCMAAALAQEAVRLQLELRAGAEQLDSWLTDEERCLNYILAQKVLLSVVRMGWVGICEQKPHLLCTPLRSPTDSETRNSRSWRMSSAN